MNNLIELKKEILKAADPKKAKLLQGFFKTGQGEYGEGDIFLGLTVPEQRKIAKRYKHLGLKETQELLNSKFHEHRLIALLILIEKYQKAEDKKEIVEFYLKNTRNINNWDLVDLSSPKLLGDYLLDKDRSILFKLAHSEDLWEKRISVISTFAFINNKEYVDSFKIAEILLNDKHDLIHKAVGWMLREVGKRVSQDAEEKFLEKHYKTMPSTMLRYAIERFDDKKRQFYLKG